MYVFFFTLWCFILIGKCSNAKESLFSPRNHLRQNPEVQLRLKCFERDFFTRHVVWGTRCPVLAGLLFLETAVAIPMVCSASVGASFV